MTDNVDNFAQSGLVRSGKPLPPNTRTSKTDGGTLVWVLDEKTGHALSVAFVPDSFNSSGVSIPEASTVPLSDLGRSSGSPHVLVHNPITNDYRRERIPLEVWIVNK